MFVSLKVSRWTRLGFGLSLWLVLLVTTGAAAASLYRDGPGARAMALGGSATALAEDPLDALFANPAALGEIRRPTLTLLGVGGLLDGEFHNRVNRRADLSEVAVGGAGAFVVPAGPVRFALGVNPDIGTRVNWRYRDAPGGADGATSYGVRPHEAGIVLLRTAAGFSVEVARGLSLGGSVGLLYNDNRLRAPFVFQSQPTLRTAKTLLDLRADGFGWNAGAGVLWHPAPTVRLGVSYLSEARIRATGRATGNAGVQFANLGLGAARPDFAYEDATVTNTFPQQVSAGVAWEASRRLTLSAQVDWINWSRAFHVLDVRLRRGNNADLNGLLGSDRLDDDVPLRWRDQFVGRLGVEQALDDAKRWTLRAGYAYANNPVPDATLTPLTAAITEHLLTGGVGFRAGPALRFDLAAQWGLPASARVRRSGLATGEYSGSVTRVSFTTVGLNASITF